VAWKKLSGDVFRKPQFPMILSILFGTGMQILTLVMSLLGATFAGSLSPLNIQMWQGLAVLLFPMCSVINGFSAGRLYAFMHGSEWALLFFLSSIFFPIILGVCLIAIDICEFIETGRSQTITLSEGLGITFIFLAINLPMNFIGTVMGYKWSPI
jgi:transmembrane 9 superfamily protein 2/4